MRPQHMALDAVARPDTCCRSICELSTSRPLRPIFLAVLLSLDHSLAEESADHHSEKVTIPITNLKTVLDCFSAPQLLY